MKDEKIYKLDDFLPYLLNQAADALSMEFQQHYRDQYGMLRTEWRVLFHLGSFGDLTAKSICERSNIHKTKVSRAVNALESKGYVTRQTLKNDRRHSMLSLSDAGKRVYDDLKSKAIDYDADLRRSLSADENRVLRDVLSRFMHTHPK
ncbi:MarR family winged helix-turn-helix transcriptional regulator [Cognatishimia sp. SS12]|uniref:MarR family winged helix-turn-helix transcriptional regulator n=1 Tax=Cognatishimia sp. SS12 TaxID=2979465 RepID=UPI0023300806|nr:MarR family winged helix-turn-helix transcriptional regulator [Cognatishimia sp. SS12]